METTRHFTATTVVVCENKALLHFHKKLKKWLPVGGHIDRDELPEEAALREIREEAGLGAKLYSPNGEMKTDEVVFLVRPMHILLEWVNQFHQHIDLIYYAQADTFELRPQDGETDNLRWLTKDEIENDPEIPEGVKIIALEALKILSK